MTRVSLYLFFLPELIWNCIILLQLLKWLKRSKRILIHHRRLVLTVFQWFFLKNCEPELSFILRKLFKKCLKESCFLDCWKVSSAVPFFKNISEMSTAKTYRPVSFLSVVSQVFEKLVINKYFRSPRKMWAFLWFPVWL